MSSDETVSFSLEINVQQAYTEIRRLQTLLYRTLGLVRRFGLPENAEAMITQIQRLITLLNSLRLSLIAVQMAAGPVGWALAGVSLLATAMTAGDFIENDMRGAFGA